MTVQALPKAASECLESHSEQVNPAFLEFIGASMQVGRPQRDRTLTQEIWRVTTTGHPQPVLPGRFCRA